MTPQDADLCPPHLLEPVVQALSETEDLALLDALIADFPSDPRLVFLKGSTLAGARLYEEARRQIERAVDLAPGYDIARFQLGLLEFTSGDLARADRTWTPLYDRAPDHPLRLFAEGLGRLSVDDIEGCIARLRQGIQENAENPPLNRDMQMLIDALTQPRDNDPEPTSATELLLRQSSAGARR